MKISNDRKRLTIMGRFFIIAVLLIGGSYPVRANVFENIEMSRSFKADSLDDLYEELEEDDEEDVYIPEIAEFEEQLGLPPSAAAPEPWALLAGVGIRTRQTQNGIDISGHPVFAQSLNLSHESGFGASLGASQLLGTAQFQSFSAGLDYTLSLSDWFDVTAGYNYYRYGSDTNNPLAGLSNSVSLGGSMLFGKTIFDLTYEHSFGDDQADYLTATLLSMGKIGSMNITPMLSATYAAYEIETTRVRRLKDLLSGRSRLEKTTIAGINSVIASLGFSYPLTDKFSISATPMMFYTPQEKLSQQDFQFNISAGVSYRLGF
ncbi:MAG TPA: hypothetical protein VEC36_00190 [Patescibacteria group bacterium]|nr:hypothetical protein [Patescibacteria group bacterium]